MKTLLRHIVYVSSAAGTLTEAELRAIQSASSAANEVRGITGVLLYGAGMFLQLLEGPEDAVGELMARIERDARHVEVRVIASWLDAGRTAPAWSMGVINLDQGPGAEAEHAIPDALLSAFARSTKRPAAIASAMLREFLFYCDPEAAA